MTALAIPTPKQNTADAQFHHRDGSCTMNGMFTTHIAKHTIVAVILSFSRAGKAQPAFGAYTLPLS